MYHSIPLRIADLSRFPLLNQLSIEQQEELLPDTQLHNYAKNSYIFHPGEGRQHIYILVEGLIKCGVVMGDEKELIQYLVKPLEYFGLGGLTGDQQMPKYAKTVGNSTTILRMEVEAILKIMSKNNAFSNAIIEMIAKTLGKTERRLEVLLTADVRTRIMFFLQDSLSFNPHTTTIETLLHEGLTQQDIASMIGTTRQTVATTLNQLRKDNIIDFTRKQITLKTA